MFHVIMTNSFLSEIKRNIKIYIFVFWDKVLQNIVNSGLWRIRSVEQNYNFFCGEKVFAQNMGSGGCEGCSMPFPPEQAIENTQRRG